VCSKTISYGLLSLRLSEFLLKAFNLDFAETLKEEKGIINEAGDKIVCENGLLKVRFSN